MARRLIPIALLVLSGSCSNPTDPSHFSLNEPISLTITGPARVAPGTTAQYSATAKMRGGSTADFTSKVVWRTGAAALLTISDTGLASGKANGETTVTASYSRPTATISVMVVPAGTYRLTGIVRDGNLPVAGAEVRVTSGQGTGSTALTGFRGDYTLYGVAGEVELTVTRPGYATVTHQVAVDRDDVFDITDFSVVGVPKIAGAYALTITAGADCEPYPVSMPRPPANELQRTYTANLTQSGTKVTVTLSGADFAIQNGLGNQFFGDINNGYIDFSLRDTGGDYYYTVNTVGRPDVVERASSGHLLMIWGYAHSPASTGAIDTPLYGGFLEFDPASVGTPTKPVSSCYSYQNRFQLTPASTAMQRRR